MRFSTKWPLLALLAVPLFAIGMPSNDCHADDSPPGVRIADFQVQLEAGLKARRAIEFEFIDLVVQKVKARQLSESEVKSVFQWARRKNSKVPFPHFQRAMRIIAAQKNVKL